MHYKIFPLQSLEILLKHGYKSLVWYIKTQACTCVNQDINLQECTTAVMLCFLEDALLRHKWVGKGLVNKLWTDMKCCVQWWYIIEYNSYTVCTRHLMDTFQIVWRKCSNKCLNINRSLYLKCSIVQVHKLWY